MSLFKITNERLLKLEDTSFKKEKIQESKDLQNLLKSDITVIDPEIMVISEECTDWCDSRRSIDLLAIEKDANLVVIELKKTEVDR